MSSLDRPPHVSPTFRPQSPRPLPPSATYISALIARPELAPHNLRRPHPSPSSSCAGSCSQSGPAHGPWAPTAGKQTVSLHLATAPTPACPLSTPPQPSAVPGHPAFRPGPGQCGPPVVRCAVAPPPGMPTVPPSHTFRDLPVFFLGVPTGDYWGAGPSVFIPGALLPTWNTAWGRQGDLSAPFTPPVPGRR